MTRPQTPTPSTAQRLAEELKQRHPERIPLILAALTRRIEAKAQAVSERAA